MKEILEEYAEYLDLTSKGLDTSMYDMTRVTTLKEYLSVQKSFNDLTKELNEIEKNSKKTPNELVKAISFDGSVHNISRNKKEDYERLSEEKRKLKIEFDKLYHELIKNESLKHDKKENSKEEAFNYTIIIREINFPDNYIQGIDTSVGKIIGTNKDDIRDITKVFDSILSANQNISNEQLDEVLEKEARKKRVLTSNGFITTSLMLIIYFAILGYLIFEFISFWLRK